MVTSFSPRGRLERRLVRLNIALLVVLGAFTVIAFPYLVTAQPAGGQPAAARARGNYTLISGQTNNNSRPAVYILDASNQEMVTLLWDQTNARLDPIGYRDLLKDSQQPQPRR